jgi:hypothetical protein
MPTTPGGWLSSGTAWAAVGSFEAVPVDAAS